MSRVVNVGKRRVGKTPSLGIRLPPEIKEALQRAAQDDVRSVSSMAEKILTDWLREKGYVGRKPAKSR
jgi:hypothetical protein